MPLKSRPYYRRPAGELTYLIPVAYSIFKSLCRSRNYPWPGPLDPSHHSQATLSLFTAGTTSFPVVGEIIKRAWMSERPPARAGASVSVAWQTLSTSRHGSAAAAANGHRICWRTGVCQPRLGGPPRVAGCISPFDQTKL